MLKLVALIAFVLCTAAAPAFAQELPLWPHGAPRPHVRTDGQQIAPLTGPESVRVSPEGDHVVSNVTQPSIMPYLPSPETATGAAIIIAPGGGHRELWIDHEGYREAQWFADHGIAAFVLKYRLSQQPNSPYTIDDSIADMRRAIRTVRANAAQWHVAPDRVGVMGFSAGGNLAALVSWQAGDVVNSRDPIDRQSGAPSFSVLVYPGIPMHDAFTAQTPPAFLLVGGDDRPEMSDGLAQVYLDLKRAGVGAELHILSGVGHGFGMRDTNPPHVSQWMQLLYNWMDARGLLTRAPAPPAH
ncbi:MAG: alpha/beta hydrolase [Terricaulis silvestris]